MLGKELRLIDFWNGGPMSLGCISAGRSGGNVQNLFMPCPMRAHHALAHETVKVFDAKPRDEDAARAIPDSQYRRKKRSAETERVAKVAVSPGRFRRRAWF